MAANFSPFPPSRSALREPNGLLTVGGDLSVERLLAAYSRGIFPWFNEGQPVLWWTPDPRAVLLPNAFKMSRSLRKSLRRSEWSFAVSSDFIGVMHACAAPRADGLGTWISPDMIEAYTALNQQNVAHSIEVWQQGRLLGGLYGVVIGHVFFGESMFSRVADASKAALAALVACARQGFFDLIDCQVSSDHLASLGAIELSRADFEQRLGVAVDQRNEIDWRLAVPGTSNDLLQGGVF